MRDSIIYLNAGFCISSRSSFFQRNTFSSLTKKICDAFLLMFQSDFNVYFTKCCQGSPRKGFRILPPNMTSRILWFPRYDVFYDSDADSKNFTLYLYAFKVFLGFENLAYKCDCSNAFCFRDMMF